MFINCVCHNSVKSAAREEFTGTPSLRSRPSSACHEGRVHGRLHHIVSFYGRPCFQLRIGSHMRPSQTTVLNHTRAVRIYTHKCTKDMQLNHISTKRKSTLIEDESRRYVTNSKPKLYLFRCLRHLYSCCPASRRSKVHRTPEYHFVAYHRF